MVRLISVFVVNTFVVVVVVVVVAVAVVFFIILIFNCLFTSKYEYKYLYSTWNVQPGEVLRRSIFRTLLHPI